MHLEKNGEITFHLIDTYDFNKNNLTPLNQAGRSQMIKGHLIPYFSIHDIIVPKDVLDDIW